MKALLMWTLSGQNIGWEETFKQAGICLVPPQPLNSTVEVSKLIWCVSDMSYLWNRHWTRDTDENSSGKQWIKSTCPPKSHLSGWPWVYLYMKWKKRFYMCREAFFTVLCNTLLQKKRCFCRTVWRFEDFSPFVFRSLFKRSCCRF